MLPSLLLEGLPPLNSTRLDSKPAKKRETRRKNFTIVMGRKESEGKNKFSEASTWDDFVKKVRFD